MPLYEYECFLCAHRFERIQRVSDDMVSECPECGGSVRRLLSAPALQFKGSGWYVTDYGKGTGGTAGEKPPAKKKDREKETGAPASEPKKSDTKDSAPSAGSTSKAGDTT
jgi:putative FmdB family regulatory protein